MTPETKFLSDGRKVAIVGKLNNTEWIVREIFVTDKGDEIPSGESFTTKSIHDQPLESYHKKEEARQKAYVERAKSELLRINQEINSRTHLLEAKKAMLANSPEIKNLFGESALRIAGFMTGTTKYLVINNYSLREPVCMEDEVINYENNYGSRRFDGLKLCSILGRSGGNIEFRISQYSDGSGSCGEVWPFETHDEAVEKIKDLAIKKIEKGHLSQDDFSVCQKLSIDFSADVKDKLFDIFSKSIQSGLDSANKNLETSSATKKELEEKLQNLKKIVGK